MRRKISLGIRILTMAVCYLVAVRCSGTVQDAARIAVISLTNGGVTARTAESVCGGEAEEAGENQAEAALLCFWHEQEDMQFSCSETGKTARATGLFAEGDPELVARGSGILAWQKKGCVTDTVTAQELFGTRQANGQLIWCGGEAYTVYGTFESLERTVVLRAGSEDTALFDHISLRTPEGARAGSVAEQLLMRWGLSGEIADFTFPAVLCGDLLLVLPILLGAGLLRFLWGYLRTGDPAGQSDHAAERNEPVRQSESAERSGPAGQNGPEGNPTERREKTAGKLTCIVMLAAAAAVLCLTLRNHLQIPADMIPTRWSDFSFWPQWWKGQKANLLQILGGAQGEMQLEALWSFGLSVFCSFLAIGAGSSLLHARE